MAAKKKNTKKDLVLERMRDSLPPQEFEVWLEDYKARNKLEKQNRDQYLMNWGESMTALKAADFQHPASDAQFPEGYISLGRLVPYGFGITQPIKGLRKENDDYSSHHIKANEGYSCADFNPSKRLIPYCPEDDESLEQDDWLVFQDLEAGESRWKYLPSHPADMAAVINQRLRSDLPYDQQHNCQLGRPSFESWEVRDFLKYSTFGSLPWLIGTNLY